MFCPPSLSASEKSAAAVSKEAGSWPSGESRKDLPVLFRERLPGSTFIYGKDEHQIRGSFPVPSEGCERAGLGSLAPENTPKPDVRRSWACIKIIARKPMSLTRSGGHVSAAKEFGACQVLSQQEG